MQSLDRTYNQLDGCLDDTLRSVQENIAHIQGTGNPSAAICAYLAFTITLPHAVILLIFVCKYGNRRPLGDYLTTNAIPDTAPAEEIAPANEPCSTCQLSQTQSNA